MTVHVDVSASALNANSVYQMIKAHAANRGSENIVFKVNQPTFELFRKQLSGGVKVSQEEADKINAIVQASAKPDVYLLNKKFECSKCKRVLTFFDVFETGRKRHGDELIRQAITGDPIIQIGKQGQEVEADCTACGTPNVLPLGEYGGNQYGTG